MANRFWVGGTGTWDASDTTHWAATSAGAGGESVPGSGDTVTFDGSSGGGTVTVAYDPTIVSITMGAFTGTIDFNTRNPTMGTFSCSGTGVRTLTMGSGTWTITGTATSWNMNTNTNLTVTATTAIINMTGASADFEGGGKTYGTLNYTGGGNMQIGFSNTFTALTITGTAVTTDTFASGGGTTTINGTFTVTGNSAVNTIVMKSSVVGTVRTFSFRNAAFTNIASWADISLTMNGTGNTWTLSEDLILAGTGTTMTLTLSAGTFNANNKNVQARIFSSSNSTTRVLTMGNATWTLTGTGTVWSMATVTGLTVSTTTSTIKVTDTSSTGVTFAGGGKTFGSIWFARGVSTATNTISGSNTFNDFKDDGSVAHTILFTASTTTTVTTFTVSGSVGQVITLNSTSNGTAWTLSKASGIVSRDYLTIRDSKAQGGANFYAGANSTSTSGNTGWQFFAPNTVQNANFFFFN